MRPRNGENAKVEGFEFSLNHQFGDSGFGLIANLTLVDSNAQLEEISVEDFVIDNRFALTGLSDTKNLVVFYEKDQWQWRLAWDHRDAFLQSLVQQQSSEPTFVGAYQQLDLSVSYQLSTNISVMFEGINLTNEVVWKHGRYDNQLLLVQDTGTRYAVGLKVVL